MSTKSVANCAEARSTERILPSSGMKTLPNQFFVEFLAGRLDPVGDQFLQLHDIRRELAIPSAVRWRSIRPPKQPSVVNDQGICPVRRSAEKRRGRKEPAFLTEKTGLLSNVYRKRVTKHRLSTFGLFSRRFVLNDIPVLDQNSVFDPQYVRRNPVRGPAMT
jgi:hypothetical protein